MKVNSFKDEDGNDFARIHLAHVNEFVEIPLDNGVSLRVYLDGHVEVYDFDGNELFIGDYENLVGLTTYSCEALV